MGLSESAIPKERSRPQLSVTPKFQQSHHRGLRLWGTIHTRASALSALAISNSAFYTLHCSSDGRALLLK